MSADLIDNASKREAELLADALEEQARRAGLRGKTINDSALLCRVCDESIPDARRSALPGVQTCIACANDLERALAQAGGRR